MYKFENDSELKKFIASNIINTRQTIEILKCSRQYISQLIAENKITPISSHPNDQLFLKKDILEFEKNRGPRSHWSLKRR